LSAFPLTTFFADFFLGDEIANGPFVHYPNEKWFPVPADGSFPDGMLDEFTRAYYNPEQELTADMLIDLQSGNDERGICALPFVRQDNQQTVYIPMNIVANLYVSNGMSAGNTMMEARTQALSEVFERYVKNKNSFVKRSVCQLFRRTSLIVSPPSKKQSVRWNRKDFLFSATTHH